MRLRFSLLLIVGILASSLLALAVACTTTDDSLLIDPVTGIQIRADIIAAGKGCGTGLTQVFKYVAVVTDADGLVRAAATYDCFADGVFQALPPSASGFYNFSVDVYAFNADDYAKPQTGLANGATGTVADVVKEAVSPDAGVLHLNDRFWTGRTLKFTWDTTCTTIQQPGVEVVAVCDLLRTIGQDGTIQLLTNSFPTSGGSQSCAADAGSPGPTDYNSVQATLRALAAPLTPDADAGPGDAGDAGASDASADAATDAAADADAGSPDAAPEDAGDASSGPPATAILSGACPTPLTFVHLPAPAAERVLDVELRGAPVNGAAPPVIGRTTCRATAQPFVTVTAQCDPVVAP